METAGTTGVVEVPENEKTHKKRRIYFELGVSIDVAPDKACFLT